MWLQEDLLLLNAGRHFPSTFLTSLLLLNVFPVTEGSSEFSDGDLDMSRRRSRRSHKAEVNYRETSESEGSQAGTNHSRKMARRRRKSSDSEGQHRLQQGAPGSASFIPPVQGEQRQPCGKTWPQSSWWSSFQTDLVLGVQLLRENQ